jgi:predicted dehydrogenase/threonine dehydrogenase-like Zn-dependent dehydrogenase
MKQVLQSLKTGATTVEDVPAPLIRPNTLLIRSGVTLISSGTERMLVNFGRANWVDKARQQPDKVKMVLEKIKTDGLQPTFNAVLNKLDQQIALGYSNVGTVIGVGSGVEGFAVGDRVASNGKHAEVCCVSANLCAKVPDNVSDECAAFTVVGAIALQGIRLANPTLGECVVVVGLGLVGLISAQLLVAQGCRVLGLDFDSHKTKLARSFGIEAQDLSVNPDPLPAAQNFSRGRGVDAVIVTASTQSNEPMHQAAQMSRKRGRIVLVGVTGLELSRSDFFEKELTFQVSCSYGPGRYDPNYEEKGQDYPIGYVRWTEQRNFEAILDMLSGRRIDFTPLISHRFDITSATDAYEVVSGAEPSLGILLSYPALPNAEFSSTVASVALGSELNEQIEKNTNLAVTVDFIGSGNYATSVLIPAFQTAGAKLNSVASASGVSSLHASRKFDFNYASTDANSLISDSKSQAVVITTRHNSHAQFVVGALNSGKHVFVEKPLCLRLDELEAIQASYARALTSGGRRPILMVGFNRRFAAQTQRIKKLLDAVKVPKSFVMTVNAGAIAANHWTQDRAVGGGRIIGEACHFVDLLRYLAGFSISTYGITKMHSLSSDTASIQLSFEDGSIGSIHYISVGSKSFPKERLEVFCAGKVLQLDNFRKLTGYGWDAFGKMNLWRQDKGQTLCVRSFLSAITNGTADPIDFDELVEVSRVSIALGEA